MSCIYVCVIRTNGLAITRCRRTMVSTHHIWVSNTDMSHGVCGLISKYIFERSLRNLIINCGVVDTLNLACCTTTITVYHSYMSKFLFCLINSVLAFEITLRERERVDDKKKHCQVETGIDTYRKRDILISGCKQNKLYTCSKTVLLNQKYCYPTLITLWKLIKSLLVYWRDKPGCHNSGFWVYCSAQKEDYILLRLLSPWIAWWHDRCAISSINHG